MTVPQKLRSRQRQRGFVLIVMTASAIAMIATMGLAIDIGHIFIVKNETQAYVDAAAIAAALQMDGTAAGLTRADNAASGLSAAWNFSSTTLTTPTVEYSVVTTGPWYTRANVPSPSTTIYARVTKTVAPSIYFVPVVMANKVYTQNVQSQAIAGQVSFSASTSIVAGLGPFTGIAACASTVAACESSAPNFGLTVGSEYDIQWPQYNSHRQGCGNGNGNGNNVSNCFVSTPCAGDVALNAGNGANPMQEVVQNWGPSINGYWGSNSTSVINQYILDAKQLQAVAIGTDITPNLANGDKQGTAKILDDRVNQDTINYDPSSASTAAQKLTTYLANTSRNGRRLMPLPMVFPNSTGSQVVGYGLFLLESTTTAAGGNSSYYKDGTGNEPYCAIYAGTWVLGATNGGVGGTSGGGRVRLVQ